MVASEVRAKQPEDLMLDGHFGYDLNAPGDKRIERPKDLQRFLGSLGNILLAETVPFMAKFTSGKIIHMLDKPGTPSSQMMPAGRLMDDAKVVLERAASRSSSFRRLTDCLWPVVGRLHWYKGRSGPFASVNFQRCHNHALLIGPGGLEHRSDLRIGMTVLGPYTRFPDHDQRRSRVFVPLSSGEFRFGDEAWIGADSGQVLFNGAGQGCAIRCARDPLIMLWCDVERRAAGL